jgi:hypothetical protein
MESFEEILKKAKPMTYGSRDDNERRLDNDIRKCLIYQEGPSPEIESVKPLVNDFKRDYFTESEAYYNSVSLRYEGMIIYQQGGHFVRHLDNEYISQTINGGRKIGTLILILKEHQYSGGNLIIYNQDKDYKSECDKYFHIIIPIDAEHEVTEVTKGYRVVLKYHILANNKEHGSRFFLMPTYDVGNGDRGPTCSELRRRSGIELEKKSDPYLRD